MEESNKELVEETAEEQVEPEKPKRPTIEAIEQLLIEEEECPIEILPNGEIRQIGSSDSPKKPLTLRENLGGEYGKMYITKMFPVTHSPMSLRILMEN